jgi:hypothetical protein
VIEVGMVNRMIKRGLLLMPVLAAILWVAQGPRGALSAAVGLGLALLNLFLAARVIGTVAQNSPQLLLPAGLITMALGLAVLTAIAIGLKRIEAVDFTITGITLVVSHLVLVLWEAPTAYEKAKQDFISGKTADLRS